MLLAALIHLSQKLSEVSAASCPLEQDAMSGGDRMPLSDNAGSASGSHPSVKTKKPNSDFKQAYMKVRAFKSSTQLPQPSARHFPRN